MTEFLNKHIGYDMSVETTKISKDKENLVDDISNEEVEAKNKVEAPSMENDILAALKAMMPE